MSSFTLCWRVTGKEFAAVIRRTSGFGLNTATQVDIMAMVAATGFLVPILMIALVSLTLNDKF